MAIKISVIGAGLRTPLLAHGLARSGLAIEHLAIYDTDAEKARLMASLSVEVSRGFSTKTESVSSLEEAISGSDFVINSIRVGGMEARARDERLALSLGYAGQETTGPCGMAMALRTVPVAIEHARVVERLAPRAWIINFTNPAGLITQAISSYTGARVVGICDTPVELFHQVAQALQVPAEEVDCDYFGLNHLGWIRSVKAQNADVTARLLNESGLISRLYPANLFDPSLLQAIGLIPTEYLYFYYSQRRAVANQLQTGATRGEELLQLNVRLFRELANNVARRDISTALESYVSYINRRNASYMKLESQAGSVLETEDPRWNPFEGATGYHRIAVEAIRALSSKIPTQVVLNTPNGTAISDLACEDVIEGSCTVTSDGAVPRHVGALPDSVRGLVIAVKAYESLAIRAAVEQSRELAVQALFTNPIVGDWEAATNLVDGFRDLAGNRRSPIQSTLD